MPTDSTAEEIAEGPRSRRDSSLEGGDGGEHESRTRVRVAARVAADEAAEWCDPEPDEERRFLILALAWRARYAFTDTETRVFHAFVMGMPRTVYALRRGVRVETVDKQAKAILDKVRRNRDVASMSDVVEWALREAYLEETTRRSRQGE